MINRIPLHKQNYKISDILLLGEDLINNLVEIDPKFQEIYITTLEKLV